MKHILILLTASLLFGGTRAVTFAQPQHVGILYSYAGSDGKDGVGNVYGLGIQGSKRISPIFSVYGNAVWSKELKGYLNEYGIAFRTRAVVRAEYSDLFLQAGVNYGHIRFADTSPTVKNGYMKQIVQPVIGGGWHHDFQTYELVADYLYYFKGNLRNDTAIDGTSKTHRFTVSSIIPFGQHWIGIANTSFDRSTYQRNPALYGQQYADIKYPSQGWQIQLGIGYRFGNFSRVVNKRTASDPSKRVP